MLEKRELVDRLVAADSALENMSVKQLKEALAAAGVTDISKAVEKSDLVSMLRLESSRQGDLAQKKMDSSVGEQKISDAKDGAWVRQLGLDGTLSWVPATEAKLDDGVAGTLIGSEDLEGAAGLSFDRKIVWFQSAIKLLRVPRENGVVKIQVHRESLLADIFQVFSHMRPADFRRAFFFQFIGEEGLDYGGVARELFTLAFKEVFNVDFGLFAISASGNLNYTLNLQRPR